MTDVIPALSIRGLRTQFPTAMGTVTAVDGVDLDIAQGETVGIVGESGSGKSVTFLSVLDLVRPPGRVVAGSIRILGEEVRGVPRRRLRGLRGRVAALAMQDALSALNPAFTISQQIVEVLRTHGLFRSAAERRQRAVELLRWVGIPSAEARLDDYPHQFSGGMRQRAMIAIALAGEPQLLIADEPTTALDVTIRAQVLNLLDRLQRESRMAVALITHDLAVVSERCQRIVVMYAGQVVETGPTAAVIKAPKHPYTSGLMRCLPSLEDRRRELVPIDGQVPDLFSIDEGCRFRNRCPLAMPACARPIPFSELGDQRASRCIRADEVSQ